MRKFLVLSLCVALVCVIIPENVMAATPKGKTVISFDEIVGIVNEEHENFIPAERNILAKKFTTYLKDGTVEVTCDILFEESSYSVSFQGPLYPVTGKGVYANQLVLGDLQGNEDFNVLLFRVETNCKNSSLLYSNVHFQGHTVLTIVLEHIVSGQWIHFQRKINVGQFNLLLEGANYFVKENQLKDDEVTKKVIQLLNLKNRDQDQENTLDVEENNYTEDSFLIQSLITIPVSNTELNRLLYDVKDSLMVYLTNYSVPESIFKGNGWKRYFTNTSGSEWGYYAYSSDRGDTTITQISFINVIDNLFSNGTGYGVQFFVKHSVCVEYDHYFKELRVLYYDFGVEFKDLRIAQGGLSGDDVYIRQVEYCTPVGSPAGLVKALAGLIPYAGEVIDVWQNLVQTGSKTLGQPTYYESTVQAQMIAHDGRVYRNISGDFSKWSLLYEGNKATLEGFFNRSVNPSSVKWACKITLSSAL